MNIILREHQKNIIMKLLEQIKMNSKLLVLKENGIQKQLQHYMKFMIVDILLVINLLKLFRDFINHLRDMMIFLFFIRKVKFQLLTFI